MADVEYNAYRRTEDSDVGNEMTFLANWTGALLSVALIVGLAVWGYRLAVRDVTGVPVVRALEGPMRVQPEDPGGRQASHQGLSVNSVQSEGQAAPTADRLILAPSPIELIAADRPVARADAASPVRADVTEPAEDIPVLVAMTDVSDETNAAVQELAEQIAATATETEAAQQTPARKDVVDASVPGVSRSLRPIARPEDAVIHQAVASAEAAVTAAVASANEDAPLEIAPGTRLVQLGAFDSAEQAVTVWMQLATDFDEYFEDKSRVVQEATSGGRKFYRLRALGFADINDARRFCAVLLAKDAACIPVVVR
ncbi:SPOR domain-containing protein [Pseudohalocynthiibacter aestuariivivens]|jgi:SPOR domain|uniref:SPOR domain-containing protein n=1 Tax=Pseudohalocynthiibacter aestuariivivens TaxID=1591409 RepID=A0ABV5JHY6_9RHOB|nr:MULTISPECIES: SPOR domain-containing protein [Pseudohalocynthiibacter]MBS9716361.1 SPOR domain-containing protein [Pseudohalocynthiibacter aestuariivivens]MCK0100830.1 SPOR domain-containing protein [Pseudohalocynthiibacter sp. F2068]